MNFQNTSSVMKLPVMKFFLLFGIFVPAFLFVMDIAVLPGINFNILFFIGGAVFLFSFFCVSDLVFKEGKKELEK